jgi:hypothetical protein
MIRDVLPTRFGKHFEIKKECCDEEMCIGAKFCTKKYGCQFLVNYFKMRRILKLRQVFFQNIIYKKYIYYI